MIKELRHVCKMKDHRLLRTVFETRGMEKTSRGRPRWVWAEKVNKTAAEEKGMNWEEEWNIAKDSKNWKGKCTYPRKTKNFNFLIPLHRKYKGWGWSK